MVSLFGKVGFITKVGSRYNLRSREMVGGHPLTEKKSSKTFAYENFICAIVSTHLGKFRRKVQSREDILFASKFNINVFFNLFQTMWL